MKYEQTINELQIPHTVGETTDTEENRPAIITRIDILDGDGSAFVLRGVLSQSECEFFIDQAENFGLQDSGYSHSIRRTDRVVAESEQVASFLFERILPFLEPSVDLTGIHDADDSDDGDSEETSGDEKATTASREVPTTKCWPKGVDHSLRRWKWYPIGLNEVFRLCRYEPGGFFLPHFDGGYVRNEFERSIKTCMVYLNDNFEGGPTSFYNDNQLHYHKVNPNNVLYEFKPQAGDVLIFNSKILHDGGAVTSGFKYIMRSEVMYSPTEDSVRQKINDEISALGMFMDEVIQDRGRYCCSVINTMRALELGAIERLFVWENIDALRYILYDKTTDKETTKYVAASGIPKLELDPEMTVRKEEPLLNWICSHCETQSCKLVVVSDRSHLGKQFVMGFNGIGAILRWKVDFDKDCIDQRPCCEISQP